MIDNQISTIHTPCKNCVFAQYTDATQNGCALNYLDKYKNKHIPILEAYDNEKEFYIINGKKCIGYRENKWFKQFGLENADIELKINQYIKINHLDYIIVIDLKNMNLDNLSSVLSQISECKIQPKKVIIVRYIDNEKSFEYKILENLFNKYNVSYPWRIQTILDASLTHNDIIHNIVSLNAKYRFLIKISDMNSDLVHMVSTTHKIVHEDLDQFQVLSNKDQTCICFSSLVYRFDAFHGNDLLANKNEFQII